MSDFNSSLPVRTENNGDVKVNVADGTVETQLLNVDATGKVSAKISDSSGNALNSSSGSLDVNVTNSTGAPVNTEDAADGPAAPGTASTKSIQIGAQYNSTLPTLTSGQQSALQATSSGELIVAQPTASNLHAVADQGVAAALAGAWPIEITDGTNGPTAVKAASTAASATDPSLVVAMSPNSPLPAGTNSIGTVKAELEDGSGNAITSQVNGTQRALDVGIDVAGVQVDPRQIRDLTAATDAVSAWVKDSSGNAISATNPLIVEQSISGALISVTNPVPVSIQETVPGTTIFNYADSAAVASNASATNTYTVPSGKTFTPYQLLVSGSGKVKAVLTWTPDGVTTNTIGAFFNSTANPNIIVNFPTTSPLSISGSAAAITVTVTNDDKAAQDIYSTIVGLHN